MNTTANILEDRSAAPTFFPATDDGYNNVWDLGGESPMTDVGDGKPKNGRKGNDRKELPHSGVGVKRKGGERRSRGCAGHMDRVDACGWSWPAKTAPYD